MAKEYQIEVQTLHNDSLPTAQFDDEGLSVSFHYVINSDELVI